MGVLLNRFMNGCRMRHLRLVCALAESGSMRLAAAALNISPPALSKGLREIETLIGKPLFTRSSQGMTSTEFGAKFVRGARAVLAELESLGATVESPTNAAGAPTLRIGMVSYMISNLLPDILQLLRDTDSDVRLVAVDGLRMSLAEQLAVGEIDFLITMNSAEAMDLLDPATTVTEVLWKDELLLVAAPGLIPHPKSKRGWAALLAYRWILPPPLAHIRLIVDNAFMQAGVRPPLPLLETRHPFSWLQLAGSGNAICAVPKSTYRAAGGAKLVDIISVEPPLPSLSTVLIYRRASIGRSGVHAVVEAVRGAGNLAASAR